MNGPKKDRRGVQPLQTIRLDSVQPREVEWLWPLRIPSGKLSSISGDPGLGKSTVTIDVAARISTGRPLPGETENREPADVIFIAPEDDLASTMRPRLDAAGADVARIHAVAGIDGCNFSLPRDVQRLRLRVEEVKAKLVVLDPLMAFLAKDSHKDTDVRKALHPLAVLAAEAEVAIVVVRHLNKSTGASAIQRGGGSIGIVGVMRAESLVAQDPDNPSGRILAPVKSNLGPEPPSLRFSLESAEGCQMATVRWGSECDTKADQLLAEKTPRARPKRDEAESLLRSFEKRELVPAAEVYARAEALGISSRSLSRARSEHGWQVAGKNARGGWLWKPPVGRVDA